MIRLATFRAPHIGIRFKCAMPSRTAPHLAHSLEPNAESGATPDAAACDLKYLNPLWSRLPTDGDQLIFTPATSDTGGDWVRATGLGATPETCRPAGASLSIPEAALRRAGVR